ncbi:WXG100 family type VII secretion target, partial [Nesterenkonia suensis]
MKFDMGASTLSSLSQQTSGSSDELGTLIQQLVAAVEPLQGKFNGQGRAAFDSFKARADEVSADLNQSLAAIQLGQSEMNTATQTGDQESADNAARSQGSANFDAARFSSSR